VRCAKCAAKRVFQPPSPPTSAPTSAPTSTSIPAPRSTHLAPTGKPPVATADPAQSVATAATRYLCVAVQLDKTLADKAIGSVLEEPHRAAASSPGVDLVCVLRYALAAQARQAVTLFLAMLVGWSILALFFFRPDPLTMLILLLVLLVFLWVVLLTERLIMFYGVIKPRLNRSAFDPGKAPRAQPAEEAKLVRLTAQDQPGGNVSVFSGYEPFLGHGKLIDSWNFTIPVDRPADQFDRVIPFDVKELTADVGAAVASLGLPGVATTERVFVNGADLAQGLDPGLRQVLLPAPDGYPSTSVSKAVIARLREDGYGRARPYLVTTVSGWDSEIVTTSTIRFSLSPAHDLLFIEGAVSLLPPVREAYHRVDHLLDRPTWRQLLGLAMNAAGQMIPKLPIGMLLPITAPIALLNQWLKKREQRRLIAQGAFNYGAELSVREEAADPKYHRYFQKIDHQMSTKIVERRTMDAITDFLRDHQVDLAELQARQNVIYNGGVFTSGNAQVNFVNSSVAAGVGAKALALVGLRKETEAEKK
jgi:hypothetical protein